MSQAAQTITSQELREFAPLNKLSESDAQELLVTSITATLSAGTPVFQPTDRDKQVFYLLDGEIELINDDKQSTFIKSGTPEAKQPLGHHIEGQYMAIAAKDSVLLSFDADMLELFLSWTTSDAYTVSEVSSSKGEWLDRLLQSRGLLRFSEEHIHDLLARMKEIHFKAGDIVINQDDEDDYYYVIKSGTAEVSRKPSPLSKDIKLAELHAGDAFGEEALLSETPRGATITMKEDGDLMRLSKKDFSSLLAEPLLFSMDWEAAQGLIKLGAVLIDVRLPDEFERFHIPGSINIPVALMRLKMKQLSHHRKYIICCDDGSRSSVAAFLLNRNGFDTYILDGGLAQHRELINKDIDKNLAHEEPAKVEDTGLSLEEASNEFVEETKSELVNEAPAETITPVQKTLHSYAEHWGDTVEDTQDLSFKDCSDVETRGKTKPFVSNVFVPVVKEVNAQKANKVTHKAKVKVEKTVIHREHSNHIRNTGIAILFAFAALSGYQYFSMQGNDTTTSESFTEEVIEPTITNTIETPVSSTPATPTYRETVAPIPVIEIPPTPASATNEEDVTAEQDMPVEEIIVTTEIVEEEPKSTVVDPATRGFINN